MKQVVHLAQYYWPHGGGVESHLVQLNQELVNRHYKVAVICTHHDHSLPLNETYQNVHVYRLRTQLSVQAATSWLSRIQYKLQLWLAVIKHRQVLQRADVIHVHDVAWWLVPLLPLVLQKTYITFHGWEGQFPVRLAAKIQRWLWAQLAVKTIHIGTYLQHFYWDKPDAVIFGAVEDRFLNSPVPENLPSVPIPEVSLVTNETFPTSSKKNSPPRSPHLVFLGRLVTENEVAKYIELVRQLRDEFPHLQVTWVGAGPWEPQCAEVGTTVGFVSDVLPFIDQADVVLASSYLSTMQAQACGKVVCSFYSHPLKKATLTTFPTAESMIIVEQVADMTTAIIRLLRQPQVRHEYEKLARAWVCTQTWSRLTDTYEQLWGMK